MISRVQKLAFAIRLSIERHGGGLAGLITVGRRAFKAARALGLRGFVQRASALGKVLPAAKLPAEHQFPVPVASSQLRLRVGVMAHVFYADLIEEFADFLANMPVPFTLLISVMDESGRQKALAGFSTLPNLQRLEVRIVTNRGRDIAPLFVTFREEILALDVIGHIHTKKSLYTGSEQGNWRRYLLSSLMGNSSRISWQLGMFEAEPRLGIIYPESYEYVPLWAHTWLSNFDACHGLAQRIGITIHPLDYIDFPAGSMFWARTSALQPFFDLGLELEDFPEEKGQTDGTLHHAIERLLVIVARNHNGLAGVLPANGDLALSSEGSRNWGKHFDMPIAARLALSSLEAELVSLDIFETLVTRPFLTPDGARDFLSSQVEIHHNVKNFRELRERAELKARTVTGHDVNLATIYQTLATLPGCEAMPIEVLMAMEIEFERRILKPRQGVVDAANQLAACGKRLVALSDMYLDFSTLQCVLPAPVRELTGTWHISCETHHRKDDGTAWTHVSRQESINPPRWLHVGDNEHADIQRSQQNGLLTPVHALRPSALFDVIPSLRPLRPRDGAATAWQDQLWLGLIANHLTDIADQQPHMLSPALQLSPASFGYVVLGPLIFDYLAWLSRVARNHGINKVLFLSREGYLLEQGFRKLKEACPSLDVLQGKYLLASRRGSGTPSLRNPDDLDSLLDSTYSGSLHGLLSARLGHQATVAIGHVLGHSALRRDIFLPEMLTEVKLLLAPATHVLLEIAEIERKAYMHYWSTSVGDAPAMVADIGYSGSIQANLSRMTGIPLGGGYFALNDRARKIKTPSWAEARHHDGRVESPEDVSAIQQHDLLLESILTAPQAQFSHFESTENGLRAIHANHELQPHQWQTVEQTHQGALRFIDDVCAVTRQESDQLSFDGRSLQIPLHCIGTGAWEAPWLKQLSVNDGFTGRGNVAAA